MKKCVLAAVALLLCLSLVACNSDPVSSGTNGGGTTGSDGFTEVQKPEPLPSSGWITPPPIGQQPYAFMDSGFFYMYSMCLYYMDTATGYSVPLCSKPGCSHGASNSPGALRSCDAYIDGYVTMMFYHDGKIYYAVYEEYGYELYVRSQDGTGLQKLAVLGEQYNTQDTSAQINTWVYAYGALYYTIAVDTITVAEDGTNMHEQSAYVLAKFDLSTGEEEELLRSEDELIALYAANDDMAVVYMVHVPTQEERERPDYTEYIKQFRSYLRLWHKESGGVSTLCEANISQIDALLGIANGKMHMNGGKDTETYAYDFASGTLGLSDLPKEVNRIWSEKYGGVKWEGYYDLETGTYYTNEYDTMPLPAEIDQFGAMPLGFGEQGMIIDEAYIKDHRGVYDLYVYYPFEKMNDGMQLSDRIVFMRSDDDGDHILQPEG